MKDIKDIIENKVVRIVSICLAVIVGLLLIDFLVLKLTGFGPLFAVKKTEGDNKVYTGVLYKAWKCGDDKVVVKSLGSKYSCEKTPNITKGDFVISDETKVCAEALEEIARDNRFIYYLSCMKSSTVFLKYGDGTKISVKEALAKKKVTIYQLIDKGLVVYQEVINQ